MMFWKVTLLSTIVLSLFEGSLSATITLGNDCSGASDTCDTGLVCETAGGSSLCKVKGDGTATNCGGSDTNCVQHATCAGAGTCSCNTGYTEATGLCTAIIGHTCANDGECTALGDANTACSSTACACKPGYKGAAGDTCVEVIGSTCENDAACSSELANSECVKTYPCTKGLCQCSSGYGGTDCLTLGYNKACSTGTDKCDNSIGLECAAGTSKCACGTDGQSYRSEIGRCTDKKLIGETCSNGDCYTTTNAECDSKCKCSTGYYADGQVCREPYGGETCTQGDTCVAVDTSSILSGESSQQAPTCTNSKCDCGSNEEVKRKMGSTCYTVCLSSGTGQTSVGQTCTDFSDCASRVCAQCPDDANPKCYNAPCSGSTISGSILVSSIILLSILF